MNLSSPIACGSCSKPFDLATTGESRKWAAHSFDPNLMCLYCDHCFSISLFRTKSSFFSRKVTAEFMQSFSESEFKSEYGTGPGLISAQPSERLFAEIVVLYTGQSNTTDWARSREYALNKVLSNLGSSRAYEFLDDQFTLAFQNQDDKFSLKLKWIAAALKSLASNREMDDSTQQRAETLLPLVQAELDKLPLTLD